MPLDHFTVIVPSDSLERMVSWLLTANACFGFKEHLRPVSLVVGLGEERPYLWVVGDATTVATEQLGKEWRKQHIAFRVDDADQVDQWYEAALEEGGEDNGKPGPRPEYTPDYYGAFVRDPVWGINFEACCRLRNVASS